MNRRATCDSVIRLAWFAVPLIAVINGCAQPSSESSTSSSNIQPAAEAPVTVRVTGASGYEETIAKHRGKVVLVDFWATWCLPCLEQFPHTVEMSRKHRDQGLAVVSVSMDKPDAEPKVREFLVKQDARFDNLLSEYQSSVAAGESFNLPGPVPCYRVYDRDGKLQREFAIDPRAEKQFTPEDVEAAVLELL